MEKWSQWPLVVSLPAHSVCVLDSRVIMSKSGLREGRPCRYPIYVCRRGTTGRDAWRGAIIRRSLCGPGRGELWALPFMESHDRSTVRRHMHASDKIECLKNLKCVRLSQRSRLARLTRAERCAQQIISGYQRLYCFYCTPWTTETCHLLFDCNSRVSWFV